MYCFFLSSIRKLLQKLVTGNGLNFLLKMTLHLFLCQIYYNIKKLLSTVERLFFSHCFLCMEWSQTKYLWRLHYLHLSFLKDSFPCWCQKNIDSSYLLNKEISISNNLDVLGSTDQATGDQEEMALSCSRGSSRLDIRKNFFTERMIKHWRDRKSVV